MSQDNIEEHQERRDFFISYTSRDQQWAEWIAMQLEEAGYTLFIQAWDFRPGSNFIAEMDQAAKGSERTLLVLSPAYLLSDYAFAEWATAFSRNPRGTDKRLLPVRIEACEVDGLLGQVVCIDLVSLNEAQAKDRLLSGVPQGRAKPATAAFPGQNIPHVAFPGPLPLGTLLFQYAGHTHHVYSVVWSPDGTRIASGSADHTIQVWNADGSGQAFTYKSASHVGSVAWSPDGTRIASASSDGTVQVWNADGSGQLLAYKSPFKWFNSPGSATSVAWSPDSTCIASGYDNGTIQVWNADGRGQPFTYKSPSNLSDPICVVRSVAWSPDSTRIASGSVNRHVQVWNADGRGRIFTYKGQVSTVESVAWSPDSTRIASSDGNTVQVWNADGSGHTFTYKGHSHSIESIAWSPDGTRIASGSLDHTVQVWSAG